MAPTPRGGDGGRVAAASRLERRRLAQNEPRNVTDARPSVHRRCDVCRHIAAVIAEDDFIQLLPSASCSHEAGWRRPVSTGQRCWKRLLRITAPGICMRMQAPLRVLWPAFDLALGMGVPIPNLNPTLRRPRFHSNSASGKQSASRSRAVCRADLPSFGRSGQAGGDFRLSCALPFAEQAGYGAQAGYRDTYFLAPAAGAAAPSAPAPSPSSSLRFFFFFMEIL